MIIVKLQGGLGNQMFQYAIARRLSIFHKVPFKFDLNEYQTTDNLSLNTKRSFELDKFFTKGEIATQKEIEKFKIRKPIVNKVAKVFNLPVVVNEKSFKFDVDYLKYSSNSYLNGYWQSELYFIDIKNKIRKEFQLQNPLNGDNAEAVKFISSKLAVSIHIRRGDYISNPITNSFHGVCDLNYYYNAMEFIAQKLPSAHFIIFSDEPEWVKNNLKPTFEYTFININSNGVAAEDMRLMGYCKHHIIANSSFSWWGAWLNSCESKIVIAPKKWFKKPEIDTSTIIPLNWIKI